MDYDRHIKKISSIILQPVHAKVNETEKQILFMNSKSNNILFNEKLR